MCCIIKDLLFLTNFVETPPICCGTWAILINAYFIGKDRLAMKKCAEFGWEGDLMNRLIHRSWGEGFVRIFLELFIKISHCSSSKERRFPAFRKCCWCDIAIESSPSPPAAPSQ